MTHLVIEARQPGGHWAELAQRNDGSSISAAHVFSTRACGLAAIRGLEALDGDDASDMPGEGRYRLKVVEGLVSVSPGVWRADEPEVTDYFALVMAHPPRDTLSDDSGFRIELIDRETGKAFNTFAFEGRDGLNAWYESNVGYRPDDEDTAKESDLMSLVDRVACLLLLYI